MGNTKESFKKYTRIFGTLSKVVHRKIFWVMVWKNSCRNYGKNYHRCPRGNFRNILCKTFWRNSWRIFGRNSKKKIKIHGSLVEILGGSPESLVEIHVSERSWSFQRSLKWTSERFRMNSGKNYLKTCGNNSRRSTSKALQGTPEETLG